MQADFFRRLEGFDLSSIDLNVRETLQKLIAKRKIPCGRFVCPGKGNGQFFAHDMQHKLGCGSCLQDINRGLRFVEQTLDDIKSDRFWGKHQIYHGDRAASLAERLCYGRDGCLSERC